MPRHNRLICIVSFVVPAFLFCNTALGWLGVSHAGFCVDTFNDPVLQPFLSGIDQSAIENYEGEPPGNWHDQQWFDIRDRAYIQGAGSPNGNDWWEDLPDVTTRLKYLQHNTTDVGVPLNHHPASLDPGGYVDFWKELFLEMRVSTWQTPSVFGTTNYTHTANGHSYSFNGTIDEVVDTFYDACRDNMLYYKNGGSQVDAGWNGVILSLLLQRAVLVDFLLAMQSPSANQNGNYIVSPGDVVHFSAEGSYDPDAIHWDTDGTYHNFGTSLEAGLEYYWDFNSDGIWDRVDDDPYMDMTYNQLLALGIPIHQDVPCTLAIRDNEGKWDDDVDSLYLTPDGSIIVPEPATMSLLTLGSLSVLIRRKRS